MGEAKRRKKLDSHFGQNYPATEDNWVFTDPLEYTMIGDLNACLSTAGLTTPDEFDSTYNSPFSQESLSEEDQRQFLHKQELYQSFFDQAVEFGEVYIDININKPKPSNLEELDIEDDDDDDEPFYNHIVYDPQRAQHLNNLSRGVRFR